MTEPEILTIVKSYFIGHNLTVERIVESSVKSPDLKVFINSDEFFFCEIKSPLLFPNSETFMFHWTTSVSKLREFIHKSVKQFMSVDPTHKQPWVLVFTSDHMQMNWTSLEHSLSGIVGYGKTVIKDLRNQRYVIDTEKDVSEIDLFCWIQINNLSNKIGQMYLKTNKYAKHQKKVESIRKVVTPVATDEIVGTNLKYYK